MNNLPIGIALDGQILMNKKTKRPPSNTESLIRLKDQNFSVRISHLRKVKSLAVNEDGLFCYKNDPILHPDSYVRKTNQERGDDYIPYFKYSPTGGASIMTLERGDEKFVVQATCYIKDKFSRRIGVKNCLDKLERLHNIKA